MDNPNYADLTLEELEVENRHFREAIEELRARQRLLLPYLEATWRQRNEEEASKADPSLTQGIS